MEEFKPLRVAVFGSCVTRDNFNRTFNPGYKDLFECVALSDHVSMVSLMDNPIDVDPATLNGLEPRVLESLTREFGRSFLAELEIAQPDYLIMDFWPDLIFGFARLEDGALITNNAWSTTKTKFYEAQTPDVYRINLRKEEFMAEWKRAVDEFFAFVGKYCPKTKVVIHSSRNVGKWTDKAGEVRDFGAWPTAMNSHWNDMDQYVLANHPTRQISLMTPELKSFETHPWGKFPVHYTFDYHQRFLARLSQLAMADLKN